jgi:hypothetical protein
MMGKKGAYGFLVETSGRKSPLARLRHRWMDDIKIDLGQMNRVVWTELV